MAADEVFFCVTLDIVAFASDTETATGVFVHRIYCPDSPAALLHHVGSS